MLEKNYLLIGKSSEDAWVYVPQWTNFLLSWGKVIISEACVKNSVRGGVSRPRPGKGVGGLARECLGPDPGGEVGGSGQEEYPGPHPGGVQARGGCIPACTEADPPADGYCCGRYASYWNAFLLGVCE